MASDPAAADPALLKDNSEVKTYSTSRFTYGGLRIFFRRLPKLDELPSQPAPVPLLVFVHGLGGSVSQFEPLLTTFTDIASCLAVDLPGCGRSTYSQTTWAAYRTDALVELLELIISDYREEGQGVVLLGHSMGAAFAARLANKHCPHSTDLADNVLGLVAICPPSQAITGVARTLVKLLSWVPWLFDLFRLWDKRGGHRSASISRFVGSDADEEDRKRQHRFNNQSRTSVFLRVAYGSLVTYDSDGDPVGGLPGQEIWSGLTIPVYLVGGENDTVTKPEDVYRIQGYLTTGKTSVPASPAEETIPDSAAPVDTGAIADLGASASRRIADIKDGYFRQARSFAASRGGKQATSPPDELITPRDVEPPDQPVGIPSLPRHPKKVVESKIFSAPATHALLYTQSTTRILAWHISEFLANRVTGRLSRSWQLQYLTRDGKWDVKNLEKWKKVACLSQPIGGVFCATKTLRDVDSDDEHSSQQFVRKYGDKVKDVIDISKDTPVYDPEVLNNGGIRYHKFSTASKIPPTDDEVAEFIRRVDRVRDDQKQRAKDEGWGPEHYVGVHCHYGFNRTGYFIVCYLVERCGYTVESAIEAFRAARPNGIKHQHFIDKLHMKYPAVK